MIVGVGRTKLRQPNGCNYSKVILHHEFNICSKVQHYSRLVILIADYSPLSKDDGWLRGSLLLTLTSLAGTFPNNFQAGTGSFWDDLENRPLQGSNNKLHQGWYILKYWPFFSGLLFVISLTSVITIHEFIFGLSILLWYSLP